jgi:short-subunit dehydrogenase
VVADFGNMTSIKQYEEQIASKLEDIDISVLAINAGLANPGPVALRKNSCIESQINVNSLSVVYMTKCLLNKMLTRVEETGKRSAIIVTSSIASLCPSPGATIYHASKVFASFFAEGLAFEVKDKIDVINYIPAGVETKMVPTEFRDSLTIPSARAAEVCFRDLGVETSSMGSFRHLVVK